MMRGAIALDRFVVDVVARVRVVESPTFNVTFYV